MSQPHILTMLLWRKQHTTMGYFCYTFSHATRPLICASTVEECFPGETPPQVVEFTLTDGMTSGEGWHDVEVWKMDGMLWYEYGEQFGVAFGLLKELIECEFGEVREDPNLRLSYRIDIPPAT